MEIMGLPNRWSWASPPRSLWGISLKVSKPELEPPAYAVVLTVVDPSVRMERRQSSLVLPLYTGDKGTHTHVYTDMHMYNEIAHTYILTCTCVNAHTRIHFTCMCVNEPHTRMPPHARV